MSAEERTCPSCSAPVWLDRDTCPNCNTPYPTADRGEDPTTNLPPTGRLSPRAARGGGRGAGTPPGAGGPPGGPLAALAPHKTLLMLIGVLVLIVLVGFLLFQFGMSFFAGGRPDPSTLPTSTPGAAVVVPTPPAAVGSPGPGASPSPGAGTVISPAPSPSPAASGVRLKVTNTEGQGANMRQRPSTTAPVLRTLPDGTVVEAIGGEQSAEGRSWRNVRDPGGATGWIASELLVPE